MNSMLCLRDMSWYRLVGEKGRFEGDGGGREDAQGGFIFNFAFQREAHERGALTLIPPSAEPAWVDYEVKE